MKKNNQFNVFLIAGYCFTGSGALHDLMKEFRGHHYFNEEFMLLAAPDGLIDLENVLVRSFSAWRSDLAIKRFKKIIGILARKRNSKLSLLSLPGKNYNEKITQNFSKISEKFIKDLISLKYTGRWRGRKWDLSVAQWMKYRTKKNFTGKKPDFEINMSAPGEKFIPMAKKYLNDLFTDSIKSCREPVSSIILDLASYHCTPRRLLNYFDRGKMIVVDRDPRDNFIEVKNSQLKNASVNEFIRWYKIMRSQCQQYKKDKKNVLFINFEDLVLNYENSLKTICNFLKIKIEDHTEEKKYFNPRESEKNIGLWKNYRDRDAIKKIYQSLKKYCRD